MEFTTQRLRYVLLIAGLGLAAAPAGAQQLNNDGFLRRDGQMQVLRNGQARPMTRDAHLPTGATITRDGFIVTAAGQRTELREGQGCDLRGRPVPVLAAANGRLELAAASAPALEPVAGPSSLLEQVFGREDDEGGFFRFKKHKQKHGKGHGHGHGHHEED